MTYSSSGPEQLKAPDADPPPQSASSNSSSPSSSSTSSHFRSHTHSDSRTSHARSNQGKRHIHAHLYDSAKEASSDHIEPQDQDQDQDFTERDIDSSDDLDHSNQERSQDSASDSDLNIEVRGDSGYITHVVQTISLVQVVDYSGSPVALETRYGTPNTIVVDSASGSTVSVSNPESSDNAQGSADMTSVNASTPGVAVTSSADSNGYLVPSQNSASNVASPAASTYSLGYGSQDAASTPGTHNATSSITTDLSSTVSSSTTLTDLSSQTTTVPTTTDVSTTSDSSMHMEMISTSSSTTRTFTSSSISSSATSSTTSSTSTTTTSDLSTSSLSSTIYTYSTEVWTSTQYANDGGSGGDYGSGATAAAQPADPTTTSDASSSSGSSLSTQQKQVIGGVVGSVAGVAFLALLILLAIKHKKRHGRHALLGEGPETRSRGLITGGDGNGSGSGGGMAERAVPFSVAATLAGLSSKRSTQTSEPAPTAERGFYRVSGKKLPSVLHNGGDGYTDPRQVNRDSVASGHTDYWRGSQAFFPSSDGGSTKLALGSPMRPVSGVPIIRTGPARTPVTEENPFADPKPRARPDSDALGDSIGGGSRSSQDGSWTSPSRFQERI